MKILIADDDRMLHKLLSNIIGRIGYETESAYDGEEALKMAREKLYDFLFIDLSMPKMNGFDVARNIRTHEAGASKSSTYIVCMSGVFDRYTQEYVDMVCENNHIIDNFIQKPFNYAEIDSVIHNLKFESFSY